jgi:predicted house-cleaning NTP pyrophosphatase (Maf/HAM1 superfamily)
MASISETGHAKNVATFEKLVTNVTGLGAVYNPSKESIQLSALNNLLVTAKAAINDFNAAEAVWKNTVKARELAFDPLSKFITRVNNALKASGSSSSIDETAMTLIRKLQGRRASPKMTGEEKKAAEAEGKTVNEKSSSQMSYDKRLDNLNKLIKLLASIKEYIPNEPELTVDGITALCNDLSSKNHEVVTAEVLLTKARIVRDHVLYTPLKGVIDISVDVKTYVKSVFGATSPQYKAISGLTLINRK